MLAGTPGHVWRIILMEGMERFSYYGFRAILTLYFVSLNLRESSAAAGFMFTSALAYAAPLVGAWLSDERWGRYATIMRFGGVYAVGLWVLVAAAAVASLPWTVVALVFVGLGTGGIKPCVSTFGADQIDNAVGDASEATRRYFAVFYASINLGSVFSYLLVPAMRALFGYAAAFAVPAVLLAAALAVFIGGRRKYTMLPPREGGVGVPAAIWRACATRANDDDARELRSIGEVMVLLPVFWMLYDQQGSIWVVQASEMKNFGGKLQPETMGVINPVLILLLLPLFEKCIYPFLERRGVSTRAPFRMMAGMIVAAAAFVVAGLLDLRVNSGERVNILWQLPQLFLITVAEILVSVTGLEYSYEKAPEAMRASVSALYLLTTAVGDLMGGFLFVAAGHLGVSRPAVLFLCAVLVLLTAIAFRFVARKHFDGFETKPVQTEEDPAEELQAVENVLLRG